VSRRTSLDPKTANADRPRLLAIPINAQFAKPDIPVTIYRPGLINAASTNGAYTSDDFAAKLLKSWIISGSAPAVDHPVLFTPVDYVSRAIVYLSLQPDAAGATYHLVNAEPLGLRELASLVGQSGYRVKLEPYPAWRDRLLGLTVDEHSNGWTSILPLLSEVRDRDGVEAMPLWPAKGTRFDCSVTSSRLATAGIVCPKVDRDILRKCLAYFHESGFLPAADVTGSTIATVNIEGAEVQL